MSNFVHTGRKIVAIGWNYAELGNTIPEKPMFFLKPTSSYLTQPGSIEQPEGVDLHHEIELGVIIGKTGRDIPIKDASSYVSGYVLALDMTARNIQAEAKKKGAPWTVAKGFDTFTPVGEFLPPDSIKDTKNLRLQLTVDDRVAQDGSTSEMIFSIPKLIQHVSSIMRLEQGDVILTGTPEGVGSVKPGQTLIGTLFDGTTNKKITGFKFPVVARRKPKAG